MSLLSDHAIISLKGPDSIAFAQAQFSSDVTALAVGQWQWSTWLTPKGRVIAVFALARPDEQQLLLVLPDYPAPVLANALQRYVFRRKVSIELREDLPVQGVLAAPVQAHGLQLGRGDNVLELDRSDAGGPRYWRIGGTAHPEASDTGTWQQYDLRYGLPRLSESQREQWTPQQLSLDRLHAYSVKKGCYPGQEIVARTHFLGQAKRGLVLFESPVPPAAGVAVSDGERDVGTIVCSQAGSPALALAVMPLEHAGHALNAQGVALKALAWPD